MRYELGKLEWQLQNAIEFSSVSAPQKALYAEMVKIVIRF